MMTGLSETEHCRVPETSLSGRSEISEPVLQISIGYMPDLGSAFGSNETNIREFRESLTARKFFSLSHPGTCGAMVPGTTCFTSAADAGHAGRHASLNAVFLTPRVLLLATVRTGNAAVSGPS